MQPFVFEAVTTTRDAVAAGTRGRAGSSLQSPTQFLAGGTTLIDLMKLNVMQPEHVVDINALDRSELGRIEATDRGLRLGALVRMAEAADHPQVNRKARRWPSHLCLLPASRFATWPRSAATSFSAPAVRTFATSPTATATSAAPGSGCAALDGFNRTHAVLGTSERCIATYPGDFAQALIAFDATVDIAGPQGSRTIAFAELHRRPNETPDIESTLQPGEMLTTFFVPTQPWSRRSLYVKVRDRESYEFALASAVVALDLDGDRVRDARIALGGVATRAMARRRS